MSIRTAEGLDGRKSLNLSFSAIQTFQNTHEVKLTICLVPLMFRIRIIKMSSHLRS